MFKKSFSFVKDAELNKFYQTDLRDLNHLRNKIEHHEGMLDGQTVGQLIEGICRPPGKILNSQNIEIFSKYKIDLSLL